MPFAHICKASRGPHQCLADLVHLGTNQEGHDGLHDWGRSAKITRDVAFSPCTCARVRRQTSGIDCTSSCGGTPRINPCRALRTKQLHCQECRGAVLQHHPRTATDIAATQTTTTDAFGQVGLNTGEDDASKHA